jgi:hypothetical protein
VDRKPPDEHPRKPAVISKGPQQGKVRSGTIVNRGFRTEKPSRGRRKGPSVANLIDNDESVPVGNLFMPEHLRILPENPAELFEPVELTVNCSDGCHRIQWTPEGISIPDHDEEVDQVITALGGDPPMCSIVKNLWQSEPPAVGDHHMIRYAMSKSAEILSNLGIEGGTNEDAMREFRLRHGKTAATQYVAQEAMKHWLSTYGAEPATGNRAQIVVYNPDSQTDWYAVKGYSNSKEHPLAAFAVWGDSSNTRSSMVITPNWYDDIRENGYSVDGNLNLGSNSDGRVVLAVFPENHEAFAVSESELSAIQARKASSPLRADRVIFGDEPSGVADSPDQIIIGSRTSWEYNDEYYYETEGLEPQAQFPNLEEAKSWAAAKNFNETFLDPSVNYRDYENSFDIDELNNFDPDQHDIADIMRICAKQGINPVNIAPVFAVWQTIKTNPLD